MNYITSKRTIAHAAAALGVGFGGGVGGAAQAGTITSKAPPGYTPEVFRVGVARPYSFDPSGQGLNVINVNGTAGFGGIPSTPKFPGGAPAKPAKLEFTVANANTASIATSGTSSNGTPYAAAYSVLPETYGKGSSRVAIANDTTSNFTTTSMFGKTNFSTDNGVTTTGFGYFTGTYDGADFTLIDFGTFTPNAIAAAPEPDTWALLALGFGGIGMMRRRQRRRQHGQEALAA